MPSPLLNLLMLQTVSLDQASAISQPNKWLIVPSNRATWDAMEVTPMHASTMLLPTVSPHGLLIPTLESLENARLTEEHSKLRATQMYQKITATICKLLLFNNPFQFALMLKLGNSINQVSSQTAALNLTTASWLLVTLPLIGMYRTLGLQLGECKDLLSLNIQATPAVYANRPLTQIFEIIKPIYLINNIFFNNKIL
jgi:hypothetical protein